MKTKVGYWRIALLIVSTGLFSIASGDETDSVSGLKIAPGWKIARAHCGACHSYQLVTSQRGDRLYWLKTIRWMQETQKLWPIPAEAENTLLLYLATNYQETDWGRRPNLDRFLVPGTVAK